MARGHRVGLVPDPYDTCQPASFTLEPSDVQTTTSSTEETSVGELKARFQKDRRDR